MIDKLVCDLKTGKWGPKKDSGSCQTTIGPAGTGAGTAGLSDKEKDQIRAAVQQKYREVSDSAAGKFKYQTGKEGAASLGYDDAILADMPKELLNSFCGVGNPFSLGDIPAGSDVLDVGCGAGFDLIVARRKTGEDGRVCGVDLTAEMIERARKNFAELNINDIETHRVDDEQLPFGDESFDIVISNGVINLSPAKEALFSEIFRVLKPGGRLQFADMVLDKDLPPHLSSSLEAWSQWVGGAVSVGDQIALMEKAGFENVACVGKTDVKTSEYTVGAHFTADKP